MPSKLTVGAHVSPKTGFHAGRIGTVVGSDVEPNGRLLWMVDFPKRGKGDPALRCSFAASELMVQAELPMSAEEAERTDPDNSPMSVEPSYDNRVAALSQEIDRLHMELDRSQHEHATCRGKLAGAERTLISYQKRQRTPAKAARRTYGPGESWNVISTLPDHGAAAPPQTTLPDDLLPGGPGGTDLPRAIRILASVLSDHFRDLGSRGQCDALPSILYRLGDVAALTGATSVFGATVHLDPAVPPGEMHIVDVLPFAAWNDLQGLCDDMYHAVESHREWKETKDADALNEWLGRLQGIVDRHSDPKETP